MTKTNLRFNEYFKRMKHLILFVVVSFTNIIWVLAQQGNLDNLPNWIVIKDHLNPLNVKTNIAPFFTIERIDRDVLLVKLQYDSVKCLMDFMTTQEIKSFRSRVPKIQPLQWKKTSYKLTTTFFSSEIMPPDPKNMVTYYYLSVPVFLNQKKTRAIIGESFSTGIAFGRGDLILCEFKDNQWQEVARCTTINE